MMFIKLIHKIKSLAAACELSFLKKRASRYTYELKYKEPPSVSEIVLKNYFKTQHQKNALLSYLVNPFLEELQNNHSNNRECYTIAQLLNELEFNVDIINWNNTTFIPVTVYDLVIDNHNNLKRLFPYFKDNTKKIFHATNAHWLYQNWIEYGRYYEFFLKKGIAIIPPRITLPGNSVEYCDAISMFGNEFTKNTYGKYKDKVYQLPMSVTTVSEVIAGKDYSRAKTKFVWLNSHGALLKGLDIVIDVFSAMPHFELYVCGDLGREPEFKDSVGLELAKAPNIKIMGWVDTGGEVFKHIISECAWIISASFSEGGGGSVLNCMAKGLIPIVSRSSSLTLSDNTGFYLEKNEASELTDLISKIETLPDDKLREMSSNAYKFIEANHSIEKFKKAYKEFLINI